LRAKLLIHCDPIHMAQRKERIVFGECLPENLIIREGGIGERLAARLWPRVSAPKQNVRNIPVFVQPSGFCQRRWRNSEGNTIVVYKNSFIRVNCPCLTRSLRQCYTAQRRDLIAAQSVPLQFDEASVTVGEPSSVERLRCGASLRTCGGWKKKQYGGCE